MRKIIALLLVLLLFVNCNKKDPCEEYGIPGPGRAAGTSISILYLNAEGTNLIDNGTFLKTNIKISGNLGEIVTFNSTDIEKGTNLAFTPALEEGNQSITITLNDTITDTLDINLIKVLEGNECLTYTYYDFTSVLYNGTSIGLSPLKSEVYITSVK